MYETIVDLSLGSVARLLSFFYQLPVVGGSFGVAIILLTLSVMVLLMPLTLKATRSTIKMTQLQPKLRELQKKHKEDKQTLNQEMMALYQSEGVNPVGGCLPMLAQMPVFLLLFNLLRGLARNVNEKPFFTVANRAHEIANRPTTSGEGFDPAYLDQSSKMYEDLTDGRTSIDFGPFDLGASASDIFQSDVLKAIPYLFLILLVVGSSYYQQRQISARRGDGNEQMTQQQKTQQQLLKILPLMSGAWSFVFPTGLVLYWATSNLFRIGQQSYITRSLYSGDAPGAQMLRDRAERNRAEGEDDLDRDVFGSVDDGADAGAADDADGGESGGGKSDGNSSKSSAARNGGEKSGGKLGGKPGGKQRKDSEGSAAKAEVNGSSNGDSGGKSSNTREQRWADRRAEKAKIQARRSASAGSEGSSSDGTSTSSRITPKGTKPTSSKKKRKR